MTTTTSAPGPCSLEPSFENCRRVGFGFFYARIDGQTVYVNDLLGDKQQIYQVFIPLTGLPGIQSTLSGQPLTSAEIFQTAQARGILGQRAIQRDDLAVHGIHPSPGYPLRVGFRLAEDTVNPYSQQGSLEVQREISGYALSVGYNYNRGIHIIRPLDLNVYQAGANEAADRSWVHNPLILQDNVYGSWARSYYHAMIVQLKKRFSRGFTVSAHHTWSKHIDENTDYNSSFEPHVQWDARGELALSHFHRKHRFVAHAVAQSPWKTTSGQGFGKNLLADFTLSGIMLARSGAPFNLNAGFDTIGDRHNDTHRPWGLGRNVGVGPSYLGLDMRLARTFTLSERMSVETIGEMFNILNKTFQGGERGRRQCVARRSASQAGRPSRASHRAFLICVCLRPATVSVHSAPLVLARAARRRPFRRHGGWQFQSGTRWDRVSSAITRTIRRPMTRNNSITRSDL